MVRFTHLALILALFSLLAIVASGTALAQDENVTELFQKGLAEFKQGRYGYNLQGVPGHPHGAMWYFDKVKRNIGNQDDASQRGALTSLLIREAGHGVIMRMLRLEHTDNTIQGEIRAFSRWLMSSSDETRNIEVELDRDKILRDLHRAMRDANSGERLRFMETIRERYGEFAVPEIQRNYLHCGNEELEGRAMFLLTRIGRNAVMPLIEIMDSPNPRDRQHAAHVLGDLNDSRAVPVLVERLQNEIDETVKMECKLALEKVLGPISNQGDLLPAKTYYYSLALKYYHQVPELIYGRTDAFVHWRWVPVNPDDLSQGGHLDFDEEMPIWAYMDAQAEEAALDALRLDNSFPEAWDLLTDVNARQYIEASARWQYANRGALEDDPDAEEELNEFGGVFARAHRGKVLVGGSGQLVLYRALARALVDRLPEVAVQVIEKLMEIGDARFIPHDSDYDARTGRLMKAGEPLIDALTYDDKRVRYAAAQALFTLNNNRIRYRNPDYNPNATPPTPQMIEFTGFYGIATARNVLIQGLGESAQRTILVITNNLDLKNDMRRKLDELGYYAYFADTPAEGLQRALTFPTDDLILLDAEIANTPLRTWQSRRDSFRSEDFSDHETIFDILADDFRTRNVPVVLIADDQYGPDYARYRNVFATEFETRRILGILPTHENTIDPTEADLGTFQEVWSRHRNDSKDRANKIAIGCAQAIRAWDPDKAPAGFFNPVIQALVARVHDRRKNTDVKVEMLKTLEQFCQAKDDEKYPVSFWNRDVIPNLLPVLVRKSAIDEPIVKYWACKVLSAVYLNRQEGAMWEGAEFDPATDTDRPVFDADGEPVASSGAWALNPFWVLFTCVDYDPPVFEPELDDGMNPAERDLALEQWRRNWHRDVLAVREAAAEVMGSAPMTDAQRNYLVQRARVNRKVPKHYASE